MKFDLFLGGTIGAWALDQFMLDEVGFVVTGDHEIAARAQSLNAHVISHHDELEKHDVSPLGWSIHYPQILPATIIKMYQKLYNLHPSFLPWGRGFYPIFWALRERTPAGATIHEIDEGVDSGPIVRQMAVSYGVDDTGGSLFQRVRMAEQRLFLGLLHDLRAGLLPEGRPQESRTGTYHSRREFLHLQRINSLENMSAHEVLDLVRCLSFPGFPGLIVKLGEHEFEVSMRKLDD